MLKIRKYTTLLYLLFFLLLVSCSERSGKKVTIIETTDIHGVIFPFDFTENEKMDFSLANSASYIRQARDKEPVLLLDNGDNLQGQPTVYYYNYIDTTSKHIMSEVFNYLGYDAGTTGNHDIEAGHAVYDKLKKEYNFPLLAANAVDIKTGQPYFKPYAIVEKGGLKIAILGLVTASIPEWIPEKLYSGIKFESMVETAKKWMPVIKKEKPDIIVGLFHSGFNKEEFEENREKFLAEDGSAAVAYNVPGFDIIFNGHDHKLANEKIINSAGDTVLMLNGGSRSQKLAQADIILGKGGKKYIKGSIINVSDFNPEPNFTQKFLQQSNLIHEYVDKVIGTSETTLSSRESYFGPSAFIDMIQKVQLDITGADISFTAPLSFDVKISQGPVKVSDLFKLYRYENMLYTMNLTGSEILKYLEYSYGEWFNTMKGPSDMLLKLRVGKDGKPVITNGKAWLKNQAYNFDSAAGIDYTVDVSKPEGSRITIKGFSDGRPFELNKVYKVAVNSYRGSGGGGHLTKGAGIAPDKLKERVITSTERDLRYFIMKYIEEKGVIKPVSFKNWKVIPEKWVGTAALKEHELLFGK